MRISVLQDRLLIAVRQVKRALPDKSNGLRVLTHIYGETQRGVLRLAATDLDLMIVTTVRGGTSIEEDGAFTVPGKSFADLLALLPAERIDIEVCQQYRCQDGQIRSAVTLDSGDTRSAFYYPQPDDYPALPEDPDGAPDLITPMSQVIAMLEPVLWAAKTKDRYWAEAVHIVGNGDATSIYASGGMLLAGQTLPIPSTLNVSLPRKSAEKLVKLFKAALKEQGDSPVAWHVTPRGLVLGCTQMIVMAALTDLLVFHSAYREGPPLNAAVLDTGSLFAQLKRMKGCEEVRWELQNQTLTLTARDTEQGKRTGIVDTQCHGLPCYGYLSVKELTTILTNLKGHTLTWNSYGPDDPVRLEDGTISVVLMNRLTPGKAFMRKVCEPMDRLALPATLDAPALPYTADVMVDRTGYGNEPSRTPMQWSHKSRWLREIQPYAHILSSAETIALPATLNEGAPTPEPAAAHAPITLEDNGYNVWLVGVNGNQALHERLEAMGFQYAATRKRRKPDGWWIRKEKADMAALTALIGEGSSLPAPEPEPVMVATLAHEDVPTPEPTGLVAPSSVLPSDLDALFRSVEEAWIEVEDHAGFGFSFPVRRDVLVRATLKGCRTSRLYWVKMMHRDETTRYVEVREGHGFICPVKVYGVMNQEAALPWIAGLRIQNSSHYDLTQRAREVLTASQLTHEDNTPTPIHQDNPTLETMVRAGVSGVSYRRFWTTAFTAAEVDEHGNDTGEDC